MFVVRREKRKLVGTAAMIGVRPAMEDTISVHFGLNNNGGLDFFGLFDGHAGRQAASFAARHFHHVLASHYKSAFDKSVPTVIVDNSSHLSTSLTEKFVAASSSKNPMSNSMTRKELKKMKKKEMRASKKEAKASREASSGSFNSGGRSRAMSRSSNLEKYSSAARTEPSVGATESGLRPKVFSSGNLTARSEGIPPTDDSSPGYSASSSFHNNESGSSKISGGSSAGEGDASDSSRGILSTSTDTDIPQNLVELLERRSELRWALDDAGDGPDILPPLHTIKEHETDQNSNLLAGNNEIAMGLTDDVSKVMRDTFLAMDQRMKGFKDGTTAVVCLVKHGTLYIGNVGDARAVLSRGGKAIALTIDHTPAIASEEQRIRDLKGFILSNRVNGIIAVTRSLGDSSLKPFVTADPGLARCRLCPEDQFLVLACDGCWDVISNQQAVDIVQSELDASHDFCRAATKLRESGGERTGRSPSSKSRWPYVSL
eukprot:TRINITY_DN9828_c0_g1_i1.p1 TRINITY_DN9828_c0_g1~~TRINITY_DN9828_c0_g1_i1.p1  ORF type:complete len:487 (+),score=70.22 TRINITY_DN9828_c0_g1_i1:226-1686(+)